MQFKKSEADFGSISGPFSIIDICDRLTYAIEFFPILHRYHQTLKKPSQYFNFAAFGNFSKYLNFPELLCMNLFTHTHNTFEFNS